MKKQYLLGMAVALTSAAQAQNAALPDSTITYWRGEPSEKSVYLYAKETWPSRPTTDGTRIPRHGNRTRRGNASMTR